VCLEVLVQIADGAPGRIGGKRLAELSGLVVTSSRLDEKPALHLSVSGGCSCAFLAKRARHRNNTWDLEPEHVPKLLAAIRALNSEAQKYRLVACWLNGDVERTEQRTTGAKLLQLVGSNQLGENVVYRTWHELRDTGFQ